MSVPAGARYGGPLVHLGLFAAWPFDACPFGALRLAVCRLGVWSLALSLLCRLALGLWNFAAWSLELGAWPFAAWSLERGRLPLGACGAWPNFPNFTVAH